MVSISNLPEDYGDDDHLLDYEITYNALVGAVGEEEIVPRGIQGSVLPSMVNEEGVAHLEFILGSCSAGGTCVIDKIPEDEQGKRKIYLRLVWQDGGEKVVDQEFSI